MAPGCLGACQLSSIELSHGRGVRRWIFGHCDWMATGRQEFGHDHHIQSCLSGGAGKGSSTWTAGKQVMVTAYLAARLDACPRSTGSRIRAATCRLAHAVRGRRKTFDGAPRSGPLNPGVAVLG